MTGAHFSDCIATQSGPLEPSLASEKEGELFQGENKNVKHIRERPLSTFSALDSLRTGCVVSLQTVCTHAGKANYSQRCQLSA